MIKRLSVIVFLACGVLLAQNPIVRQSRVTLFSATAATGTATSSAVLLPNYSGFGTLTVVGSGITGSPSGCQVTLAYQQSLGGTSSSVFATQAFTPANSYQGFQISPSSAVYNTGDSMVAVFSCSVYPSAGTITVAFDGTTPVNVIGTVPVSISSLPSLVAGAATIGAVNQAGTWTVQPGNTANTTPWLVTGTGGTFPVTGTFWQATQPVSGTVTANAGTNLNTSALALETGGNLATLAGAITSAVMQANAKNWAGTALGAPSNYGTSPGAVTVPGVNAFITNTVPVSGTFWQTTQPVSIATAPALVASSAIIGKVGIDQTTPGTTNGVQVNAALPAGTNTIGKVDLLGNAGAAVDQAPGSAAPANAVQMGGTDGTNTRVEYMDPCKFQAWTYYPINVSANTQIGAGTASKNYYICKLFIAPVAAAANVNIVESATSGNACATSPTGMMGGATAALGADNPINGGFVLPADSRAWMKTATAADALCIFTSAQVTGVLAYVQF